MIGGQTSSSVYTCDGLRLSHTVGGTTTSYVWDVTAGLPEVLQDGTNTYVYGLGLISATDGSGNPTYFLRDGLGSTVALTDGSGSVTATYAYDAFGAVRSQTGSVTNPWQLIRGENGAVGANRLTARPVQPRAPRSDPRPRSRFSQGSAAPSRRGAS